MPTHCSMKMRLLICVSFHFSMLVKDGNNSRNKKLVISKVVSSQNSSHANIEVFWMSVDVDTSFFC